MNGLVKTGSVMLFIFLAGCATGSAHKTPLNPDWKYRIAVLPVKNAAEITKLSDIKTIPPGEPDNGLRIDEAMHDVSLSLTNKLIASLNGNPYYKVVPQEDTGADISLSVNLSGYGSLNKKWITLLLGTGLVEAGIQYAVVTELANDTTVGLIVALEDIVQELIMWVGGGWLLNKHYAPVTLESRLIDVSNGKVVWEDTTIVTIDDDALEALPAEERVKKEVQLRVTADKAIQELTKKLEEVARTGIYQVRKRVLRERRGSSVRYAPASAGF